MATIIAAVPAEIGEFYNDLFGTWGDIVGIVCGVGTFYGCWKLFKWIREDAQIERDR